MGENINNKVTGDEKLGALKLSCWEFSPTYEGKYYVNLSAADQYSICMAYDALPQFTPEETVEIKQELSAVLPEVTEEQLDEILEEASDAV